MDMVNRLIQIAKGISLSLGETCEAVVHDRDHRIAYIANGHISGREQGQQMEESVFKYFEDETRANNGTVVRLTRKNNGELHKPWAPKRSSCGSCASWRRRVCSS